MKPKMIGLEETIVLVMKQRGCSRRAARKMVTDWVKQGKVRYTVTEQTAQLMPPKEAGEAFEFESEQAYMSLGYLIERFSLSPKDILAELKAGRLMATASEDSRLSVEMGLSSPACFAITAKALRAWITHPKTPPHLIAQLMRALLGPRQ